MRQLLLKIKSLLISTSVFSIIILVLSACNTRWCNGLWGNARGGMGYGTGFGMGVLMFSLFLKTYDLIPEEIREREFTDTIYIASISEDVSKYALKLAQMIRFEGFPCIVDYRFSNLKNQLSKANDLGVLIVLIIGPKEMEQNKVTIKINNK